MSYTEGAELSRTKRKSQAYKLEEALNKTYLIKVLPNNRAYLNVPVVLAGKRVKLVVVK